MGLSCGMNVLKILLFIFNFIFWLLGIALLAVGIWSRVDGASWESLLQESTVLNAANLMIAAGVIVAVIGFLGCCGAIKKSECMLISYSILIFLIFILEIGAGIFAYTKRNDVQIELQDNLGEIINKSYKQDTKSDDAMTEAVDWFQQNVKCCGSDNPRDWEKSAWFKKQTVPKKFVPESCCKTPAKNCNSGKLVALNTTGKIYTTGCVVAGKNFAKDHLWKIGGAAVGIGIVQLFGIVFAICLCKAIRQEDSGTSA